MTCTCAPRVGAGELDRHYCSDWCAKPGSRVTTPCAWRLRRSCTTRTDSTHRSTSRFANPTAAFPPSLRGPRCGCSATLGGRVHRFEARSAPDAVGFAQCLVNRPRASRAGWKVRSVPGLKLEAAALLRDERRTTADEMAELGVDYGARKSARRRLPSASLDGPIRRDPGCRAAERRPWLAADFALAAPGRKVNTSLVPRDATPENTLAMPGIR